MTNADVSRRKAALLSLLCAAVYFCSYLTRHNYAAVMVEIIAREGFSRVSASAALTGLFVTYGVGQLISGYLGDRLPPQLLIFGGLLVCAAMNLLIPFCPSAGWMTAVWSVNGLAQAMMWPPLVKVMTLHLQEQAYKRAVVWVSWGGSLGTIAVYLAAPLLIALSGWRLVFFVSAAAAVVMAAVWLKGYRRLQMPRLSMPGAEEAQARSGGLGGAMLPTLITIMLALVFQGVLRDGITSWTPTLLSDAFQAGASISILSSVVLPLFAILCHKLTAVLNQRLIKNEMACAACIFAAGLLALGALTLAGTGYFLLTVLALALAVGSMHGVNLILTCLIPPYLSRAGKTAFVSGLLNSCTYIGSALSTYGVAVLTDRCGWNVTLAVWCLIALGGTLCCAAVIRKWGHIRKESA